MVEKYEVVPLEPKVIRPELISGELMGLAPTVAGVLCSRRLIGYVGSNFYHWEAKWGSLSSPWQRYGPIVQLKRMPAKTYCADCLAAFANFIVHKPGERCPARAK